MTPSRKSYTIAGELTIDGRGPGAPIIQFSDGDNELRIEDWLAAALEFKIDIVGRYPGCNRERYTGRVRMTVEQIICPSCAAGSAEGECLCAEVG
jgi:hypothetical protein